MAKFEKQLFYQNNFLGHDTSSCTCSIYIVNAKYQKASVKALVQADFLYMHKQNPYLKANRKKMANFIKLLFCQKKHFFASNFFKQMFNESVLCKQSIELFRHKLWYKLNSPHMHI